MNTTHNTTSNGYTLIELLLYVAIVGSLLTAISFYFSLALEARVKNQTISEVDQQGTFLMDTITQTIRNATSITTPAAAGSGTTLTLVVPTGGLSPTTFNLSGDTLQITESGGAAVALSNGNIQISSLTFKNLTRASTPGVVQISFIVSRTNPLSRNMYDYQKTFTSSAEVAW